VRDKIVAEARTWVGTPFLHQGRVKGRGVDCVGLVIGVARELGLAEYKEIAYGRQPDTNVMRGQLEHYLEKIHLSEVKAGDIYWMRFTYPMHTAIASDIDGDRGIIHSYSQIGKCIEHRLDSVWESRIAACYRYKGLS